jgi:hypothetical protein
MAYRARGFWSSVITKSNLTALLPIDQQKQIHRIKVGRYLFSLNKIINNKETK